MLIAGAALLYAWRTQDRLRLAPVLALALGFHAAWIALHLGLDVTGDKDASVVFRWQGNGLLNGDYPRSEYPLGAVLLFASEAWVGGGSTKTANAILMIPFQLATVAAIWATRTAYAPWLAAFVALWPLNAFSWEFKFDLVPAALLAVGAVLAWRNRWALSGAVLGLGALVKWTPGLTAVVLVAWLLASRRGRDAIAHAGSFAAVVLLAYVPFLVWNHDHVLAAYSRQSGRSITPESMWYLLLRPFDLAHVRTHLSFAAGAPEWADALAVASAGRSAAGAPGRRGARPRPPSCSRCARRPGAGGLPADEPDLQPAVRDRPLRSVGGGRGARRRHTSRAARGRSRGGARQRVRTRSCTRSRSRTTRRRG